MSDISVLGIFVADISFSGPKIPSVGETVLGNNYNKAEQLLNRILIQLSEGTEEYNLVLRKLNELQN